MEYLKEHKNIIKKEANSVKKFIITFLQNEDEKGRNTDRAVSDLADLFYQEYLSSNLIEKHKEYFKKIINDLRFHSYNYDPKKVDRILKTLENEVYGNFMEIKETFSKHKIEDYEIFEKLTYESFFSQILKYTLYQKVNARLENSIPHLIEAIKLFYELNNYTDFSTTFLIDESEKITVLKINNIFKKYGRKFDLKKITHKSSNEKSIIDKIKSTFDENEKIILLNLAFFQGDTIEKTEKLKLILLIGELTDYSLFEGLAKNSTFYKKVASGIDHYGKKNQEVYLDSILLKIETLELNITKGFLRKLKSISIGTK
ncbi:hypothetical protein [Flavobacterium ovatum]|uniref:hypothetical protein n=1 Tax=Flavobacterium ovatum TaxID=1928857 RepID=UPI00344FB2E3